MWERDGPQPQQCDFHCSGYSVARRYLNLGGGNSEALGEAPPDTIEQTWVSPPMRPRCDLVGKRLSD
jgi:hypothetical protein